MPEVTAIEPQKKKKGRFNIYLDGDYAFSLKDRELTDANLKVGQKISDQLINQLVETSEVGKVFDKVLKFLSYRPRSEREIKNYLAKKKVGVEIEKKVFKKLGKLNFISDYDFTNWWIENRLRFRPKGVIALKRELIQKGIDRDLINSAINEISKESQIEVAFKIAQKYASKIQHLDKNKFYQKMTAYLARRGFSWEIIKVTIDTIYQKR